MCIRDSDYSIKGEPWAQVLLMSLSPRSPSQRLIPPEITATTNTAAARRPVFRGKLTMNLRSPFPLALLGLLLSCGSVVHANFDIYVGWGNTIAWTKFENPSFTDAWWIFDGEPDCNMAWRVQSFPDSDDVSGGKLGIRCEGTCGIHDSPWGISVLEMHFRNNPLLHWSTWQPFGYPDGIGV